MEVPGAPQGGHIHRQVKGGHIHRQGRGGGGGEGGHIHRLGKARGGGQAQAAQTKFKTAAEMNFNYHISFQQGKIVDA